jgi:hypothetical protein
LLAVTGGDPETFFHLACAIMVGHLEIGQDFFIKLVVLFGHFLSARDANDFVLLRFIVNNFACSSVELI